MEYEIKTEVFGNGIISQEILEKEVDLGKKVIKSILNTQEEGIKKALIDL